ncbi:hypothetical protein LHYA1_G007963 [Lachnellula hyalina]|uniref:Inner kinetochore subunit AME1 domain-containing protein n=1 Tax=Lachnellula hyalina TaxID=1316788 RepID=A0A8H8QUP4_9HELO|nr:uncharacterized protein LHYA1_G007963 [Lachnellula hyalina]TVY23084.1 hypothetical protein LHYA1_G007963 [Lachnellula hyalina]
MASREERMQQRLRGSQRRQVKDVDFGLTIPAAPISVVPAVSPPQLELPSVPSTRSTPTTRSRAQQTPSNRLATQDGSQPGTRSGNVDANISAKRRKLDTDVEPASSHSTGSARTAPRPDIYALPGDDVQDPSLLDVSNASDDREIVAPALEPESDPPVSQRRLRTSRTPSLAPPLAEEITESPADAPGSGHRSRIDITKAVSTSSQLHILQESSIVESELETPVQRKRKRGDAAPTPIESVVPKNRGVSAQQPSPVDDVDELSPDQPTRHKRKHKAVVEEEYSDNEDPSRLSAEQEEAEQIDDLQAAAVLKKNRGRRVSRNFQPESSPDLDDAEVQPTVKTKTNKRKLQKVSSPVEQSHPKKSSAKAKSVTKKAKLRSGSPIPVPVYRLTRQPIYDEDDSDAEILNSSISHTKRGGVNTIDVLSGISHEIIGSGLEMLEEGGNNTEEPSERREYKTKWQALKSFGEDLQTRLLDHVKTINLDNAYSLEKRVREQQKVKLGLRDDILRIRAERQQVALQMDGIRMRHENEGNKAQSRDTVNASVYDIEMAVERGRATEPRTTADGSIEKGGLDILLKRVAGEVSNEGHSGGILQRIKNFNAFLERAASALESKRV